MIPVNLDREIHSSETSTSVAFGIDERDSAHIMSILRDTLYSDKVMAVLREYSTNAWDAHRESGRGDVPIRVTLPTLSDPTLRIRDVGPGLSPEGIENVYSKYGRSTKRDSNAVAGMLGIGSKSGFAYSDSFVIVSWHAGFVRTYVAVIDESERGRIDLMAEEACDPAETGVEIQIAVRPSDIHEFMSRAQRLFVSFDPRPTINCQLDERKRTRFEVPGIGAIYEELDHGDRGKWTAVMGPVPYRIDLGQLVGVHSGVTLGGASSVLGGVVNFDIGGLQVAASREELKYGDATRKLLIESINLIIDEYVRLMLVDLDKLVPWERRLRVIALSDLGLPVPQDLSKYKEKWVRLAVPVGNTFGHFDYPETQVSFSGSSFDSWKKKFHSSRLEIHVARGERFIIDDVVSKLGKPRSASGYTGLGSRHELVIVPRAGYTVDQVRKELNELLDKFEMTGIPIEMLSDQPWTAPPKRESVPRDNERARSRCFLYDDQAVRGKQLRLLWTPSSRVPKDTDVFVVLDSYRVDDMDDFYDTYWLDRQNLQFIGIDMPPIVGYKTTKAITVSASSCKGTEYRKWRTTGMVDMIMAVPGLPELVQANGWNRSYQNFSETKSILKEKLPPTHPIITAVNKEAEARMLLTKASSSTRAAASHVYKQLPVTKREADLFVESVQATYPLLKRYGLDETIREMRCAGDWADYINLLDAKRANDSQDILPQ